MRLQQGGSLRGRLTFWLTVFILVAGAAAAAVSFTWAFEEANELQDDVLAQVGNLLATGHVALLPATVAPAPGEDPDAQVVIRRLGAAPAAGSPPFPTLKPDTPDGVRGAVADDGSSWRLLVRSLPDGTRVALGQRSAVRDEIAHGTAWRTLLPLLVLLPALVWLVRLVVQRTLEPVAALSRRLDARREAGPEDIPSAAMPQEIRPFVDSINRLLAQTAELLAQQRRFIADAAHELRSPLTALTLQAENLAEVALPEEARRRLAPLQEGLDRTRALLEQLLTLARVQQAPADAVERVEADRIAREVVAQALPQALAKDIDLGFARAEPAVLGAAPLHIATLLRNVVDNALRYTPPGGVVDVGVWREGDEVVLSVEDNGPGLPQADLERVFDPFWRAAGAADTGSGLGLAIVRDIALRLGGSARLTMRPAPGGLRFEYRQPAWRGD